MLTIAYYALIEMPVIILNKCLVNLLDLYFLLLLLLLFIVICKMELEERAG